MPPSPPSLSRNLTGSKLKFSSPKSAEPLKVFVAGSHRGRPDLRSEFTVDLATAQLLSTKDFSSDSPAKRAMSWGRWIHTGEAGGWIGQSIAAFACVATLVLIYSGFALSWRRFFRKEKTA
ncbi:MAG: PepSY domain-containing protein [Akkermansiaceae bacterium]|nr:PepSY domain-containing protein [Akkermansiaceae bacterium]